MAATTPRVYVSRRLPAPGIRPLEEAGLAVDLHDRDEPPSSEELGAGLAQADAALCLLTDRIDAAVLAAAPRLRIVANLAVGYDNVDLEAAAERGVVVTNTPDVLTEATADLTWALILATARHVVPGDALVRSGAWRGWRPNQLLGSAVHGKTLGIYGLGAIGRAVARRAAGFAMPVVYTNRQPLPESEEPAGARFVPFDELVRTSDVLSIHAPLTDETRGVFGREVFEAMKPTALVINAARGPIVDEAALVTALDRGLIGGAGLDVFEREPQLAPGLAQREDVVVLPHLGSATVEARSAMVRLCCDNILAVLGGRPPLTPVSG